MIKFLSYFLISFLTEMSLFEITHHIYCRKNKGRCSSCRDWSCPRQQYLDKNGELKKNERDK